MMRKFLADRMTSTTLKAMRAATMPLALESVPKDLNISDSDFEGKRPRDRSTTAYTIADNLSVVRMPEEIDLNATATKREL